MTTQKREENFSRVFPRDINELHNALDFIASHACGLNEKTDALMLVCEEWFVNCCKYTETETIEIFVNCRDDSVIVEFADHGAPFDPSLLPKPVTGAIRKDMGPGGLGIFLMFSLADHIEWKRNDGTNRLIITFSINPAANTLKSK